MINYYVVTNEKVDQTIEDKANWVSVINPTNEEKQQLTALYGFPSNILESSPFPEIISRMEMIPLKVGKNGAFLRFNYLHMQNQNNEYVENNLEGLSVLFIDNKILTVSQSSDKQLVEIFNQLKQEWDAYRYLAHFISLSYASYIRELKNHLYRIKKVNSEVKSSMKRDLLLETTTIEHNLVFLENVLKDQETNIDQWLEDKRFMEQTDDQHTVNDIRLKMKVAQRMVHMYRELVGSTSGLISDIMDNRLNNIMEQLETIELIIAVPTLIFSLWGINTGGLVGRDSPFGTIIVVLLALFLGIAMARYLKRKEFKE